MVVQNKFTYTGRIGRYVIQEGIIKNLNDEVDQSDKREEVITDYIPGDKDALFKKLVALNRNSEHAILDFYNRYGSLLPYLVDGEDEQEETLESARRAIFYFKIVFKLEIAINSRDFEEIRMLLDQLFVYCRKNPEPTEYHSVEDFIGAITNHSDPYLDPFEGFDKVDDDSLYNYAKHVASGIINTHIKTVRPWFKFIDDERACSWKVHGGLLSAIYFDYYLALCKNLIFKMCANPTCPNPVEIYGADNRKVFCGSRCANTVSKRRVRDQKKRGELDGNS